MFGVERCPLLGGSKCIILEVLLYYTLLHAWPETTTKLSTLFQVLVSSQVTLEIFFLGLGLTVTEINIKKVQKQDLKNLKNVGMAYQKVCKQGGDSA